jgi:hypothetical protein
MDEIDEYAVVFLVFYFKMIMTLLSASHSWDYGAKRVITITIGICNKSNKLIGIIFKSSSRIISTIIFT